jgi:uncharacterized membrane protein YbaN (DUF454 family)/GNAT superfamily N-acetyltransferase
MPSPARSPIQRTLLIAAGLASLGLGIAGIFLPLLPTTPFLLLSAFCFLRSSPRRYDWLINHRIFGLYIYNYLKYRAVPLKTKILTVIFLWTTLGFSIFFFPNVIIKFILGAVGLGVSIHILSLRTLELCKEKGSSVLTFRQIEPRDIKELLVLRTLVKENRLSMDDLVRMDITEETVTAMITASYRGWLCQDGTGRPVGFSMGNRTDGEMWVVAVLPEYEKRGIGKKLMLLVQDWLFQFHDQLWLTTEHDPANRAYGFYQSLGWREAGIEKGHSRFILRRPELSKS